MAIPVKVGSEFLVNTQTAGDQTKPKITELSNGGFIVTWQDASGTLGDNSGTSIKAQIYAADGAKVGSEFLINTQTAGAQTVPAITGLSGGGFVVTWQTAGGTAAQVHDADGNRLGSEFLINTQTLNYQNIAAITGLNNGGFVVTWLDYSEYLAGSASGASIKSQIYAADGSRVGSEFQVRPSLNFLHPQDLSVSSLSNGGFVIAWEADALWDGHPIVEIREQVFAADGSKVGSEMVVASPFSYGVSNVSTTGLSNGGFVVAYESVAAPSGFPIPDATTVQIHDANGNKVGSPIPLGVGLNSAIASLSNGGFLVTWGSKGQMFAADGTKVGPQFPVQSQTVIALQQRRLHRRLDGQQPYGGGRERNQHQGANLHVRATSGPGYRLGERRCRAADRRAAARRHERRQQSDRTHLDRQQLHRRHDSVARRRDGGGQSVRPDRRRHRARLRGPPDRGARRRHPRHQRPGN